MHALSHHSAVSPADRLSVTFLFAILAHLIVILGVTFVPEDPPERHIETLDVVLVPLRSEVAPDRPDYLAPVSHDGSDGVEKVRPDTAGDVVLITGQPATATVIEMAAREAAVVDPGRAGAVMPSMPVPPIVSTSKETAPSPARGDTQAVPLQSRSHAIAALSAEIERKLRAYAERPRRKWISARTREYEFAAYMDAWRRKVERIGNLNYPDEAVQHMLSGSLLLEVALKPDGTVEDIALRRSSGLPILDAAAVRIVKLAAPFARFPQSIAAEVDVLHIERTWVFHSGDRVASP